MTNNRRRKCLLLFAVTALLGGLLAWPGYVVIRQERLNRGLILKICEGDAAGVTRQLVRGADPNARAYDDTHMTPQRLLQTLLHSLTRRTPATRKPTALFVAVYHPHPEIIAALLRAGAQPEARDTDGRTPLIAAAYRGWARNVRALLDGKPDINAVDAEGRTALMGDSVLGYQEEADMLLAQGANPDLKTRFGRTALMWAAGFHYPAVVRLLLQKQADANLRDNEGKSALMYALGNGAPNIVLPPASVVWTPLRRQATHAYDNNGRKYTIGDAEPEEHDTVALLLQAGADANTRDNRNVTALQQAKGKGYPDLIAALKQAGAKP